MIKKAFGFALFVCVLTAVYSMARADLPVPPSSERGAYKQRLASLKTIYLCRDDRWTQREMIQKMDAYMRLAPNYFALADRDIQEGLKGFFANYATDHKAILDFQVSCPDEKIVLKNAAVISYDYDATPAHYKGVPVLLGSIRFSVVMHSSFDDGVGLWNAILNPESFFISEDVRDEKGADPSKWPKELRGVVIEPVRADRLTPSFSAAIAEALADVENIWTISF